jgi:hypothetical protein
MNTAETRLAARVRVGKLKKVAWELGRALLHSPENGPMAQLHCDVWRKLRSAAIESRAGHSERA